MDAVHLKARHIKKQLNSLEQQIKKLKLEIQDKFYEKKRIERALEIYMENAKQIFTKKEIVNEGNIATINHNKKYGKMIFIFPGQGSQYLGMGKDLYDNFASAKLLFEEVNDAINYNLSKIIFDGPEDGLNSTEHTQPAIMAVSIAAVRIIEQESGKKISEMARYVMGHSLGEYSALCAVGALSVADTAKLLHIRGQAMQNVVPIGEGTMVALLGVDIQQAEEIAKQVDDCEIANDNGGGQIVLSCLVKRLEKIKTLASNIGIRRVIQLSVSTPFHSTFMQPAADKIEEALGCIKINPPALPLISNVTANAITNVDIIKKCLVKQVVGKIRWRESVLYCTEQQIKHYIELGPKNVLTNLVKRIDKSSTTTNIGNSEQITDFLNNTK